MATRAIIYTRISRDAEGEALGVERQRQDCEARADRDGWEVVDVLVENDTGASANSRKPRPLYDDMMARADRREFEVILAYSNSRLTRRPMEFEGLIQLHDRTGIRIATIVSGDDDLGTADGRFVARVKAAQDAAEAERVSERTRRALRARVEKGLSANGGVRPFGYNDTRTGVVQSEADALRDVARRILAGESLVSLVKAWNEAGEPATVNGSPWTLRTLAGILKSPRVAGLVEHQGRIVGAAAWPAILDMDTWEAVRARLANGTGDKPRARSLLAGMLVCGLCGTAMTANGAMYRCNRAAGSFGGGCGKVSRNMATLDGHIVAEWARHMTEVTGSDVWESDNLAQQQQGEEAEAEREDVTRRIETTRAHYAAGFIGDEDFFPVIESLRARLAELDRQAATPRGNVRTMGEWAARMQAGGLDILEMHGDPNVASPITSIEIRASWSDALDLLPDTAWRRKVLRAYVERITVNRARVRGSKRFDPTTVHIAWQ
jgi:site-specific DNA recombinase